MSRSRSALRGASVLALASVGALLLAGCATGTAVDTSTADNSDGTSAPSAERAFPVTIDSAFGDVTIEREPQRIVTIGWGSADTVVALGSTLVGVEAASWGGDADEYFPWVRDAIEAGGDELPVTFSVYPEIDVEAVLELAPDLILAPQSGLTPQQYATLSELAPTVAYPDDAWRTSWDDQIGIIGQALGKSDEAATLVSQISTDLADTAAANPEFADLSFAYVAATEPGALAFYQAGDPRVDIITGLGLTLDETVAAVPLSSGTFASTVGLERADLLDDVDVLFTWFNDQASADTIEAQPLFAQIPAVAAGAYVPNVENQLAMASSMITPLSVPWALDAYVPLIQQAAARAEQN